MVEIKKLIILIGLEGTRLKEVAERLSNIYDCNRLNIANREFRMVKPAIIRKFGKSGHLIIYGQIDELFLDRVRERLSSYYIIPIALIATDKERIARLKVNRLDNDAEVVNTMFGCILKIRDKGELKDVVIACKGVIESCLT